MCKLPRALYVVIETSRSNLVHAPGVYKACMSSLASRNQFSDRCFATAGPTLRNSLPNSFGNRTRSLKRLCLISWAAAPCLNVKGAD